VGSDRVGMGAIEGSAGVAAGGTRGTVTGVGAEAEDVTLVDGRVEGWSSGNLERLVSRFFFSVAKTSKGSVKVQSSSSGSVSSSTICRT